MIRYLGSTCLAIRCPSRGALIGENDDAVRAAGVKISSFAARSSVRTRPVPRNSTFPRHADRWRTITGEEIRKKRLPQRGETLPHFIRNNLDIPVGCFDEAPWSRRPQPYRSAYASAFTYATKVSEPPVRTPIRKSDSGRLPNYISDASRFSRRARRSTPSVSITLEGATRRHRPEASGSPVEGRSIGATAAAPQRGERSWPTPQLAS